MKFNDKQTRGGLEILFLVGPDEIDGYAGVVVKNHGPGLGNVYHAVDWTSRGRPTRAKGQDGEYDLIEEIK